MSTVKQKILAITLNPAIDKVYAVDDFNVGGVFRPVDMTATAGGKGLNVARVASQLGESVIATGFIGGGNGQFIEEQIRETGIIPEFVSIAEESRICIAITDHKNHTSTEILEAGPTISEAECEQFLNRMQLLLTDCAVVTASGSLPRGFPSNFYRKLIEIVSAAKIRFILDTSGEPLVQGIQALPYMVKPNLEEAAKLFGENPDSLEKLVGLILKLKQQGIEMPCITLGENGCLAGLPDGVYHFYGPRVEVLNTVGSGDSFVAGCAVGLVRGLPLLEVIKLGMASGMANTQFFQTGMVSLEIITRFYEQIQFHVIRKLN